LRCRKMVSDMESNVTFISKLDVEFEKIWKDVSTVAANTIGEDVKHLKLAFKNVFYQGVMHEMENELTRQKSLKEKNNG